FSKEIILMLANAKYSEAWTVIPVIAFGCVFLGYYHFFANVILLEKKTKSLALISICTGFISMVMNLLLIPVLSSMGAALACVAAYSITSVMAYMLARKLRPDIRFKVVSMYLTLFALFALSTLAYTSSLWHNAGIFFAFKIVVYAAIVGFFALKYRGDIKTIIHNLKSKFSKQKEVSLNN
ncbi:MAG: hypothetical protein EOO04_27690, partial [Chitinophagaceae bacterium]